MNYPTFMKKINRVLAVTGGIATIIIAILTFMEAVLRKAGHPTSWTLDATLYLLVLVAFFGSSYAFQMRGHVEVDFVRESVGKHFGKKTQRNITIFGYIITLAFLIPLLWSCVDLFLPAYSNGTLTFANMQIPIAWLYFIMIFGTVGMILTVFFIILDLLSGSEEYL